MWEMSADPSVLGEEQGRRRDGGEMATISELISRHLPRASGRNTSSSFSASGGWSAALVGGVQETRPASPGT